MAYLPNCRLAALVILIPLSALHSQDQPGGQLKERDQKITVAEKSYRERVEAAQKKRDDEIAVAAQAALKSMRGDLSRTGPGDVARAIELAKRIYLIDPTDTGAKKLLLAASINPEELSFSSLKEIPPLKPGKVPVELEQPAELKPLPDSLQPVKKAGSATPTESRPGFDLPETSSHSIYPLNKNKRPITLPEGAFAASAGIHSDFTETHAGRELNTLQLVYGADFGILENFQAGFFHGIRMNSGVDFAESPLTLSALASHHIDLGRSNFSTGIRASLPLHFNGDVLQSLHASLPCRLNFAGDTLAVWLGERPGQLQNEGVLELGLGDTEYTAFNLPVGLSFQLSDEINLGASTRLYRYFSSEMDEASHRTYNFGNVIPFSLSASYSLSPSSEIFIGYEYTHITEDSGFEYKAWALSAGYVYRGF